MAGNVNNSVFWVGGDGNVYLRQGDNVQNFGKALKAGSGGFDAAHGSGEASQIADPNPQPAAGTPPPSNPNGASSGNGVADKSNDIGLQTAGLNSVDAQTKSGLSAVDQALAHITGQYDTEAGSNEGQYTTQSNQNQNNLQKNKQTALLNASQGLQGLKGTLASLGALNGSGIDLANKAVTNGANEDLSGAADTYATNQSGLDTSIGAFRAADKERRQNAATSAEDAKTAVNNNAAKSKQTFYSNLANDYAAEGDAGNAQKFTGLASSLYPDIAGTSVPSTNLAYQGAAFTPGSLSNYLTGANSTQVSTTSPANGSSIPGVVAANTKRKLQTA